MFASFHKDIEMSHMKIFFCSNREKLLKKLRILIFIFKYVYLSHGEILKGIKVWGFVILVFVNYLSFITLSH